MIFRFFVSINVLSLHIIMIIWLSFQSTLYLENMIISRSRVLPVSELTQIRKHFRYLEMLFFNSFSENDSSYIYLFIIYFPRIRFLLIDYISSDHLLQTWFVSTICPSTVHVIHKSQRNAYKCIKYKCWVLTVIHMKAFLYFVLLTLLLWGRLCPQQMKCVKSVHVIPQFSITRINIFSSDV